MVITTQDSNSNALMNLPMPRTGKRGVPQQFPRRLFEMLDGETHHAAKDTQYVKLIEWSTSGKAFRIHNVEAFASTVLPKYFRTKKFSSFQRNLNLYGFTKVRRGADSDMYAHPNFARDDPKALLQLRKITSTTVHRRRTVSPTSDYACENAHKAAPIVSSPPSPVAVQQHPPLDDRGKLDLLALAMEQEFSKACC